MHCGILQEEYMQITIIIQMSLIRRRTICGTIAQNYELNLFLYTNFQEALENAETLFLKTASDEAKPFEHKYAAREILLSLFKSPYLVPPSDTKDPPNVLQTCANALLRYHLGTNYNETEEYKEAESEFQKSLQLFDQLPQDIKLRHINSVQDIFNSLGILHCNWANHKKGIAYFAKAEQMYELVKDAQGLRISNRFAEFMKKTTGAQQHRMCFGFYIDGGLDKNKLEANYTQTLFYMAQTYGKLNKAALSASYCARTLQRQLEGKNYQIKDWAVNCVSLSEYFLTNHNYAQAEYCLWAAVAVLPSDVKKRKKLRATIAMQLGKYYAQRLADGIQRQQLNTSIEELESLKTEAMKKYVEFPSLAIPWPKIEDIKDLEKAKEFFRLANTQYKKAMEFFVLDGYVTQHIGLRKSISDLYHTLSFVEPDPVRLMAMLDRRRDILEPVAHDINTKAYCAQMQEVWYELINIYGEMHARALEDSKNAKGKTRRAKALTEANKHALKSVEYSKLLIELLKGLDEQGENVDLAIQAQYMNIAKMYSEIEVESLEENIKYYKESLDYYTKIKEGLEKYKTRETHVEEYRLSKEMCELLPIKISRIVAERSSKQYQWLLITESWFLKLTCM
eukprot:TRINITY_DN140_c1_g2_i1.p2 TRINITY_DN140_c1_g2~~TRINITY_DN140_c1_g2_i1.p2  ORF type:complete len:622 (+),score=95.33 TRINITY_DN140_c1_g2_i1:5709-7574(+)